MNVHTQVQANVQSLVVYCQTSYSLNQSANANMHWHFCIVQAQPKRGASHQSNQWVHGRGVWQQGPRRDVAVGLQRSQAGQLGLRCYED